MYLFGLLVLQVNQYFGILAFICLTILANIILIIGINKADENENTRYAVLIGFLNVAIIVGGIIYFLHYDFIYYYS